MNLQDSFGWPLGPAKNERTHRSASAPVQEPRYVVEDCFRSGLDSDPWEPRRPRGVTLSKAAHEKLRNQRKSEGDDVARSPKEPRHKSNYGDTWRWRGRARGRPLASSGPGPWSRFWDPSARRDSGLDAGLERGLYESPLSRLADPSELGRLRRKRRSWLAPESLQSQWSRSWNNRWRKPVGRSPGRDRSCVLEGFNDLEAKLVNMSAKNGSLILLAWSLNEEFQMIEKNVESLMVDMQSLHQDLKDLRFANDLLHLLKEDLDHVSLKRWPFMLLNENFCEDPQQEFNLII